MSAYINRNQINTTGTGEKPWVPLNRWANDDYTVKLTVNGMATFSLEGTISQINRGESGSEFTLNDESGTPISGITSTTTYVIAATPLEAIRVNQTAGTGSVDMHIMQSGDS